MDRLAVMEAFVVVVSSGSFSTAARRLNIGQPAVSKSVAQLEERLGVKLLARNTHGLTPTEAGLKYYERARRVLEEVEEAELAARGMCNGLKGRLRVSAAVTFARIHVMPRLPEFLARHPDLDMEMILDDRNIDLVQEGVDVALRMGPLPDSSLTARRIATAQHKVLATPTYFARAGEPSTPAELTGHQSVVYSQGNAGADWTFRRDREEVAISLKGRLHISAAEGVRAAVLSHAGITIVSEWMFAPELATGAVQAVLEAWELKPLHLWAVFPVGRTATTKARTFVRFVEEVMSIGSPPDTRRP